MTLWDIETGSATKTIPVVLDGMFPLRILPVGKSYFWLREKNSIFVIDVETGNVIANTQINFDNDLTNSWVFIKETGEVVIVLCRGKLTIVNSKTGT